VIAWGEFMSISRNGGPIQSRRTSRPRSPASGGSASPPRQVASEAKLFVAKRLFLAPALFSGAINILMLAGSLFMLQVYDRVLPSRSIPTLVALVVLVGVLYAFTAALELVRSRIFARIGRQFDAGVAPMVFAFNVRLGGAGASGSAFRDLEQVRNVLASGAPAALFDLPWTPLYVVLLTLLHPWLGAMGVLGVVLLASLTWLTDRATTPLQRGAAAEASEASALAETVRRAFETTRPLGMDRFLGARWRVKHAAAGQSVVRSSDAASFYTGLSRFVRMTLQSLVLALGAYLVISDKATGGVMIGSSVLFGRALSPIESAIAHWRGFVAARQAYGRLGRMAQAGEKAPEIQLPQPNTSLVVANLVVGLEPGRAPVLKDLAFSLRAGDGMGVIGPSGSGKSTLARTLVGLLPAQRGAVRFDDALLGQWSSADAARFIGYLPQEVELFAGSIAENIGRYDPSASDADILRAAEAAGLSTLIRELPEGFDTRVGERGSGLSAGQRQRIALARALFGDPFLLVLDEPNSALDAAGEAALSRAVLGHRRRGGVVVLVAHRPSALQAVNKVLVLANGVQRAFGPRDETLKQVLVATPAQASAEASQ
jgi:PrtD family type I secretion system ABC transporter